jgi:4-alpha-glucanotransferase
MGEPDTLDRLAELAGIEPQYVDTWGSRRDLSSDTKLALLAAMGFSAATEDDRLRSLAALKAAPWRRMIDEVVIVRADGPDQASAQINHAAASADRRLAWTVTEESGRVHRGEVRLRELALAGRRVVEGDAIERRSFGLPADLPTGYHRLELTLEGPARLSQESATLIVTPGRCHLPAALERGPGIWGFAVQLYALEGRRSWGMGDFNDLCHVIDASASLGAQALGLNPTSALFIDDPRHISPYSPSSRSFLNALYIDPEAAPDFAESDGARERYATAEFQQALAAVRQARLVDYAGLSALKLPMLELLYQAFCDNHLARQTPRAAAFQRFREERGEALEVFAAHEALAEFFRADRKQHCSWRQWPAGYQDPKSPQVAAFVREHARRVGYFAYLQWEADRQLSLAAAKAGERGMTVGLYRDLALGADPDGADAWAQQRELAFKVRIGAPPDGFNPMGQNWGLPPFNPFSLRVHRYGPFIGALRNNMRHAGALRIDHILGFLRLYWIPEGASAREGGYVRYPLDELLAITALESERAGCVVIGEDLGTVPAGLRASMAASRILSCRVLYFERQKDGALSPLDQYPSLSQVSVSTHDLPTLLGSWRGRDIELHAKLGVFASADAVSAARRERAGLRLALLAALRSAGLWATEEDPDASPQVAERFAQAVHSFLARTPARLLMVQLEDVLGVEEQANLPGTIDEHPNWRQKLPLPHEQIMTDERMISLAERLNALRPPPPRFGAGREDR